MNSDPVSNLQAQIQKLIEEHESPMVMACIDAIRSFPELRFSSVDVLAWVQLHRKHVEAGLTLQQVAQALNHLSDLRMVRRDREEEVDPFAIWRRLPAIEPKPESQTNIPKGKSR
jgi:hypothetical protein